MKKLLIAFLTIVAFSACDKDDPGTEEENIAQRTVLIYMAAQNNLNSYAHNDLEEIQQGIKNIGDNHVVVYHDRAMQDPVLLHYRNGELCDSIPMDPAAVVCDPTTLKAVAKRVFTDYPANDYGLVLWGHASGWLFRNDTIAYANARRRAYGGTNMDGSNYGAGDKWMNIHMLAKALAPLPHLKFIFADCCNMMCAENAYELKDVCDYFIGSAAEIPGNGAPYDKIVPAMMEKETFYQSICDKYASSYLSYPHQVTLAVVKSSEMVSLAAATKTVLQSMKAADNLQQYPDLSNLIYYLDKNLYDMNHFIKTYASEAEYNSWKQAFDKAVVYKKFAKLWATMNHVNFMDFEMNEENYGGMSMFVPQWKLQTTDNKYIQKFGWYYAAGYDTVGW